MADFYKAMEHDGMRPAAALRTAQIQMWRQKRWSAPYYWAAFQILKSRVSGSSSRFWRAGAGSGHTFARLDLRYLSNGFVDTDQKNGKFSDLPRDRFITICAT
jgi:hypothetical protein